ncbi:MAG: hypothetical protein AAGF23_22745 [Acidobacteriota bacterium]
MEKGDLGSVDYTLTYSQGETGNGEIELTLSGQVFQLMTGGRLESVGDRVVSPFLEGELAGLPIAGVDVDCLMVAEGTIRARIRFYTLDYDTAESFPVFDAVVDMPLEPTG